MKRGTIFIFLFILFAAGIIGASQFLRSQPPLLVTIAVNPLADSWVRAAAAEFNATQPITSTARPVQIVVQTVNDLDVWANENLFNWTATTSPHPAAWIASMSAAVDYAERYPFEIAEPSLAQTPLVWGGFSSRMNALIDPQEIVPLSWRAVNEAVEAGTWANYTGGTEISGNVSPAFNRPTRTMPGFAAVISAAAEYFDSPTPSSANLSANDFRTFVAPIFSSVSNYSTLGDSAAGAMAARGMTVGQFALLPESEWLTNLRGQLIGGDPLVLAYPAYAVIFDFPFALWTGDTTPDGGDARAAAEQFAAFLLTPAQQTTAQRYGLRTAAGDFVTAGDSLFAAAVGYGLSADPVILGTARMPGRSDAERLLSWLGTVVR